MIKKISLLILLTLAACGIGAGILWASQAIASNDVRSMSDINLTYRIASGFSQTEQTQEASPNGTLGTTVNTKLRAANTEVMVAAMKELADDINRVSKDELVNLNVEIEYNKRHTFHIRYFPATPGDYQIKEFNKILDLLRGVANGDYKEFNATIYPLNGGRYVTAQGTHVGKDTNMETLQPSFVKTVTKNLEYTQGDVFDLTYTDKAPVDDNQFVPFTIQTFVNSNESLTAAENVNFNIVDAFRNRGANSFVGATNIRYIQGTVPGDSQLVLVIPETDNAGLENIQGKMFERGYNKVIPPQPFTIFLRYDLNGDNQLTFRNNFAY